MSVLTHFELCAFQVLLGMLKEHHSLFAPLLMSNVIESGPHVHVYQSLGVPL